MGISRLTISGNIRSGCDGGEGGMKLTEAPRRPSSRAMPAPIPREAPVMMATFPLRGYVDIVRVGDTKVR